MTNPENIKGMEVARTLGVDGKRSWFRRVMRLLFWLIIFGAAGTGGFYWYTQNETESVRYETAQVQRGNLVITVSATGTLEPIKTVDVGIEVSGTVESVDVDYNDHVEVGQVLARIDTSKLEAQTFQSEASLQAARAKLLQAQATVKEAEAQLARLTEVHKLSDGKLPSQYELDAQQAAVDRAHADEASAKASIAQAQATLDANKSDLEKAVVHSPINGVVLERSVEPGQTVASAFQSPVLFTLAEDLAQMELQVDVDEADVGLVREGQEATFTVDAYPERIFPAMTTQVRFGSETVDGVVTYKAVLKVDNSELILRPGMTATASLTVDKREDALLVPNIALRFAPPVVEAKSKETGGSLLGKILPHPPRLESAKRDDTAAKSKEQQVWTLRDGQLTPIMITKGVTDGKSTEVVDGALEPGTELVANMVTGS